MAILSRYCCTTGLSGFQRPSATHLGIVPARASILSSMLIVNAWWVKLATKAISRDHGTFYDLRRRRLIFTLTANNGLTPLPFIVVEDGLASNAPHIRLLKQLDMRFLLIVKQDDHEYLFDEFLRADDEGRVTAFSYPHPTETGVTCEISFVHDLPLNKSNQNLRVNLLMYSEYAPDGTRQTYFTWVTDLAITKQNAPHLVAGGRARWKIENEAFNTLKNQGYHFEHNYGHGQQNLSIVFAMLIKPDCW